MKRYGEALAGWTSLALIALCLAGCGTTNQASYRVPPITITEGDLMCMSTGTKAQILTHNCTVDYDKDVCPPESK